MSQAPRKGRLVGAPDSRQRWRPDRAAGRARLHRSQAAAAHPGRCLPLASRAASAGGSHMVVCACWILARACAGRGQGGGATGHDGGKRVLHRVPCRFRFGRAWLLTQGAGNGWPLPQRRMSMKYALSAGQCPRTGGICWLTPASWSVQLRRHPRGVTNRSMRTMVNLEWFAPLN